MTNINWTNELIKDKTLWIWKLLVNNADKKILKCDSNNNVLCDYIKEDNFDNWIKFDVNK